MSLVRSVFTIAISAVLLFFSALSTTSCLGQRADYSGIPTPKAQDASSEKPSGSVTGVWGPTNDGIRVMLYSSSAGWKMGDAAELRVKIKNVTASTRVFKVPAGQKITMNYDGRQVPVAPEHQRMRSAEYNIPAGEIVDMLWFLIPLDNGPGVYSFSGKIGDNTFPGIKISAF